MSVFLRSEAAGLNRRRFFSSVRTVMMVRFDPGTSDSYLPTDLRDEAKPDPYLARRRYARFASMIGISQATGPAFSGAQKREAVTGATTSIADVLARLPKTDGLTMTVDVTPTRSVRRVNTYRKADELDLTLDWRSVPFDSRMIRAIFVLHYEGTTTADEWGSGDRERFLVPATGENLRFVGVADEISDAHGDEGDVLNIRCRDLTAVFTDTKWPAALEVKIPARGTIVDAIQAILATNPSFSILRGPFLRTEGPLRVLDPALYPRLTTPAAELHRSNGVRSYALRMPPVQGGDSSVWDVITDLCVAHGLRPYVEKDKLVLCEPRILYKDPPTEVTQRGEPTWPTAYRKRIGDTTAPTRRMVYGSNVAALRFNRKLARIKAIGVEVSSRNPDASKASERLIVVRWPENIVVPSKKKGASASSTGGGQYPATSVSGSTNANSVDASGSNPENKLHVVQLHGITDRDVLKNVAKQIYEGMGRQELGVVIETEDPASYSDHPEFDPNEDPDLLDIRMGDPVRILVTSAVASGSKLYTLSELQVMIDRARLSAVAAGTKPELSNARKYLEAQGWASADAAAFVKVLASAELPQEFRVVGASITFDSEAVGFNIQLDCRDYVRARSDPEDRSAANRLSTASALLSRSGRVER